MSAAIIYTVISLIVAALDFGVAVKAFRKGTLAGRYLGLTCVGTIAVDISYLVSILSVNYLHASIFASVYFVSVDLMLYWLLKYSHIFTKLQYGRIWKLCMKLIHAYLVTDAVVLLINPFHEIAIHYVARNTPIAHYAYQMMPLYQMHLLFSYSLVALVIARLFRRQKEVPAGYRVQYRLSTAGVVGVVLLNAVFLFLPGASVLSELDVSILLYSAASFIIYWTSFEFPTRWMPNYFRSWILENISQGVVLFDYEKNLLLRNDIMKHLFPQMPENITLDEFVRQYGLLKRDEAEADYSFLCYAADDAQKKRPIRCDYRTLSDDAGNVTGHMLVFTNSSLATDLLTGYMSLENFRQVQDEIAKNVTYPVTVAICDINDLQAINDSLGRNVGDQAIRKLADTLKDHFSEDTFFIRGAEANLILLCYETDVATVQERLDRVCAALSGDESLGFPLSIQSAVCMVPEKNPSIMNAVDTAMKSMKSKKLMDTSSAHSQLLTSLLRALQTSDGDTEAHVLRTQEMGARLGKLLKLSDSQQSDLALLCVLHDIGKIGVPLEILNKPGKLTDAEWATLRSHVEKGYQIAIGVRELSGIADMILHHHERWDGNGYPDGLSKESIPLLSRIISVVDAYDAMVNDRVYRKALTQQQAIGQLKQFAGSQFDPAIVAAFIRMLDETQSIDWEDDTPAEETDQRMQQLGPRSVSETPETYRVHGVRYSRYILDEDDRILSADAAFESITGYSQEDVAMGNLTQTSLIPPEDRSEYQGLVASQLARNPAAYCEHRLLRKDGRICYVFCYGRQFYDSTERAGRSEIILADSANTYSMRMFIGTERSRAQNQLSQWEKKYRSDPLTGLLNHEAFKNDVEMKLLNSRTRVMLLMMDVDHFKEYNDTYGHRAGDTFLILVARTLAAALRKNDLACRMGGDEFAAALFYDEAVPDHVMLERAQQICDKINLVLMSEKGGTSLSMGAVISRKKHTNFDQLYEQADHALYDSKSKGRGCMSAVDNKE